MNTYVFAEPLNEKFEVWYATEDCDGVIGRTDKKWLALARQFATLNEADAWMKDADPDHKWLPLVRADGEEAKERHDQKKREAAERLGWQVEWEREHEQ